jgi:uncharacterized membrane protein
VGVDVAILRLSGIDEPMIRNIARFALTALMVTAGVLHFTADYLFVQIVPPFLPWPYPIVYLSGVIEIALGVLLQVPRFRRIASLLIIALLVAVFPANIYMAVANLQVQGLPAGLPQPSAVALWLRLPLQFLLMWWAYRAGQGGESARSTLPPREAVPVR